MTDVTVTPPAATLRVVALPPYRRALLQLTRLLSAVGRRTLTAVSAGRRALERS